MPGTRPALKDGRLFKCERGSALKEGKYREGERQASHDRGIAITVTEGNSWAHLHTTSCYKKDFPFKLRNF